jgi:hypothetical protein
MPLFFTVLVLFLLALAVKVVSTAARHVQER